MNKKKIKKKKVDDWDKKPPSLSKFAKDCLKYNEEQIKKAKEVLGIYHKYFG